MVRLINRGILAAVGAALLVGLAGAAPACADSPWWHLSSASRPTYLQPGQARDEVQKLTVSATAGVYALEFQGGDEAYLEVGWTAAQVQATLEREIFGPESVQVTGGPGGGGDPEIYELHFTGERAEQPVSLLAVPMDLLHVVGGKEEVSVAEVTRGRHDGVIVVTAVNRGDANANPATQPVTITDKLPPGVEAIEIEGAIQESLGNFGENAHELECSLESLSCTYAGGAVSSLAPFQQIQVRIAVNLNGATSGEVNEAAIVGGGAPAATARQPLTVLSPGSAPPPFGVSALAMDPEEEGGGVDTQAGSHPFQLTSTVMLDETVEGRPLNLAKDLRFRLPPGLIGNPTPFPQCTLAQFLSIQHNGSSANECSAQTVVGVARIYVYIVIGNKRAEGGSRTNLVPFTVPLFNLEPAVGEPARFGFIVDNRVPVVLNTAVRSGGDYNVYVNATNISQQVELVGAEVTLWGVPGSAHHDNIRGEQCLFAALQDAEGGSLTCPPSLEAHQPPPLVEMPTSCTGPLQTSVEADSWREPGVVQTLTNTEPMPALDGCNRLPSSPSISVAPDGQAGSTPTGLTVGIHVPQDVSLTAGGLGESDVKSTTVALPVGVQISPAAADGLLACSDAQAGFIGVDALTQTNLFTPSPVGCPNASKIGTAEIKTPLLPEPVVGAVYLAAQDANPFGSLIAMYVYAENAKEGVAVELVGEVKLNEVTGQIVATFPNTPQLPFEEAKLHFFGGNRAPLSTPALCGSYTSTASITPWSGNEPTQSTSTFAVTSGPNGAPCASPRPFNPGFAAGTTSVQAGGFSPLTLTLSRPDADQALGKLAIVFPPGISAGLRGVKLCEEPQAASGQCPAESQIGTVTVSAGLGGDPFPVETGKAYITGPYEGDPFGVDVVVPAVAGPFNLGTEVVRSKVDVDPTDAHLTVVSDKFPTILDGIPLQLQHINVTVNRPGFVFNPTDCDPMKLTGELESSEGASADVATPFQVTNCAALSFKPEFKVSTSAKTSRVEGASLHVNLTLPNTPRGTAANVAKVKVSLPKQLPSPLKTLQKACTEKVFAENPSNCPVASRVGEATVTTPVLEGPLSGPAYFVSHGGAKYPELIIVLVGEDGVTVQVHGETFISKQGITTATFSTVPDVPFSNFELELPEREYPALTANGNLCKGTLLMPTEMVGQNGFKINQETKISVTGCPKHKKVSHKKTHKAKKAKRGRKKG